MTTIDDWNALDKALWNHEAGVVSLDGHLVRRLMSECTELRRKVKELEVTVDAAVDANPFAKVKPSEHSPVSDEMVNKLRGIYRRVLPDKDADLFNGTGVCESRYAVGALSHEAADRMESLLAEVERLRPDAARLDWCDRESGSLDIAYVEYMESWDGVNPPSMRVAIDKAAGEEATWLPK